MKLRLAPAVFVFVPAWGSIIVVACGPNPVILADPADGGPFGGGRAVASRV
jgi:hypothetical protein